MQLIKGMEIAGTGTFPGLPAKGSASLGGQGPFRPLWLLLGSGLLGSGLLG